VDLTVLGKSPAWQDASGACSGYLVREQGRALLLDCGGGVFGKLRATCDYTEVDAVLVTHLHPDHFIDLVSLGCALRYSPRAPLPRPALYVPPGAREQLRRMSAMWADPEDFERAFEISEYDPRASLALGPLEARFVAVPHFIPTFAVELTGVDGRRFTFGADCRFNEELAEFARGAHLVMLEATDAEAWSGPGRGHMTAREAGELARRAEAGRLIVTHFSDELDPAWVHAEASAGFGAAVELAAEGARFTP
jgi:ribonuclease BN (tRNA processing enzyme)